LNTSYTHINSNVAQANNSNSLVQNAVSSTTAAAGGIPSFGSSFTYSDYGLQVRMSRLIIMFID